MNDLTVPITEQFRPEFENLWQTEYQQMLSRADGLVDKCTIMGEYREFPLLKKTNSVRKLTKRFEETAPEDIESGKRRVTTDPYLSPLIFDRKDQKKFGTLESPIGPSIANQRAECERNMDSTIIGVPGQVGGLIGKAIEVSEEGIVSYPDFDDANRTIAPNYAYGVTGGANTGMSHSKLVNLNTRLGKINVRSQDGTTNNPAPFGLLLGYSQIEDLLNDPKFTNKDWITALERAQNGELMDVYNFTVRAMSDDDLPYDDANDLRTCIAFAKNAVKLGYNEMPNHELDVLPEKTHAIQSVYYFDWGLGRIWDQGVWKLPCLEA